MANVDPYVIPIPERFLKDEELRRYFEYTHRFLHDLWSRTGGGVDIINSVVTSETFETSLTLDGVYSKINELESELNDYFLEIREAQEQEFEDNKDSWTVELATANYDAAINDFVEGRNGVTITLDSKANHGDQIITGNGDGSTIVIDGNSCEIRYKNRRSDKLLISREGTFIHWYKFVNGSEEYWRGA